MAENLKWGKLPFNFISAAIEWKEKEAKHKLINDAIVLAPSNGNKSKAGNAQYDSKEAVSIQFATLAFIDNKLVGQVKKESINSYLNFTPIDDDNSIDKWCEKGCVIVINCKGNVQLEYIASLFSGKLFTGALEIDVNNSSWQKPNDDITEDIKTILEADFDDWEEEDVEKLSEHGLPDQILTESLLKTTKKFFKLELKSLEELEKIAKDINVGSSDDSDKKGKSSNYKGGGSNVVINSYESAIEKYRSFTTMLGLKEGSTIADLLQSLKSGTLSNLEVSIAAAFCKIELPYIDAKNIHVSKPEGITANSSSGKNDSVLSDETESASDDGANSDDSAMSDFVSKTSALIHGKIPAKKLPANWVINANVTERWCKCISWIINNNDVEAVTFSKEVGAIMGASKKSSLVLYNEDELVKIAVSLGME